MSELSPLLATILIGWAALGLLTGAAGIVVALRNRRSGPGERARVVGYVMAGLCLTVGLVGMTVSLLLFLRDSDALHLGGIFAYGALALLGVANAVTATTPDPPTFATTPEDPS